MMIALVILLSGWSAMAQQKIGYINSQELISIMPETKKANDEAEAFQKTFADQMKTMQTELETKVKAYQASEKTLSEAIKAVKEKEIQDLQNRMVSFEQTAKEKIDDKVQELLEPINKKAQGAIESVAAEKGYSYIMDTSIGAIIYAKPEDNILNAVKAKLGIKDTPATNTTKPAPAPGTRK
ncbi:MAG TPA: OmpH family outer membrane protein [Chitinophagaceae bacterium]|nr:OmpH family outer membrane protein [Chitinophagaceae bacterium]